MYLQQCRPRDRAKLSGKLFLFTEEDRAKNSIHCGLETIQREISWKLSSERELVVQHDRLQIDSLLICILALVEHLYKFNISSFYCEPWTCCQIQLFIPVARIASSSMLIYLKVEHELEMRLQKIGDWWFLRITQTERNANLTVVIISLGIQCIQLPPIVFRWSVFSVITSLQAPTWT
jgi:hypothetical protein